MRLSAADADERRFIPAGAGNSCVMMRSEHIRAVHPRGRGEQDWQAQKVSLTHGSSPRARGTELYIDDTPGVSRFIPAGAGNSERPHFWPVWPPVHPRGRGEQLTSADEAVNPSGSSPRARGTELLQGADGLPQRFIPAGAGNSRKRRYP